MGLVNPYCSVQQVRDYIRNQDVAIAGQIEDAINAASRYIDAYKQRDYFEHDHTTDPIIVDWWSKAIFDDELYIGLSPIIELLQVRQADADLTYGVDYKVDPDAARLFLIGGPWMKGRSDEDAVQVFGRFGYEQRTEPEGEGDPVLDRTLVPDGIPAHITRACVMIAAALSRQNMVDVVGVDGSKQSVVDVDIPKAAMALLGPRSKILV